MIPNELRPWAFSSSGFSQMNTYFHLVFLPLSFVFFDSPVQIRSSSLASAASWRSAIDGLLGAGEAGGLGAGAEAVFGALVVALAFSLGLAAMGMAAVGIFSDCSSGGGKQRRKIFFWGRRV